MPPNLRKSQPNLAKPSEGGSFNAGKKPAESTNPLQGLNISAERELGSAGGIKATGKLTAGIDGLITQQGVQIEADAANRTLGIGAGIGSTKGKLGVNIGGKVGYNEEGKISIRGAEAAVNIGGFGGSASIDDEKGIGGSISVAGAKIEVAVDPNGKKSLSVCYGVPGGELCVTFEPDPGSAAIPPKTQTALPVGGKGVGYSHDQIVPLLENNKCYHLVILWHSASYNIFRWNPPANTFKYIRDSLPSEKHGGGVWTNDTSLFYAVNEQTPYERTPAYIDYHEPPDPYGSKDPNSANYNKFSANFKAWGLMNGGLQIILDNRSYKYFDTVLPPFKLMGTGTYLKQYISNYRPSGQIWDISAYEIACSGTVEGLPKQIAPTINTPAPIIVLPNYPQQYKPMKECCDKIEEIYRYLGIAKLKKNKFPVSNAFLVPGGSGNDDCLDYYTIFQALFRMLANGLIINPKSKPMGSEWQNVNATAWAGQMYEMMAESMSDGNSTQRFEVAAIMQLVQIMSAVAESSRKIEFVADTIGFEPQLVPEELPVCFTIYESHKGFGKTEPPKKLKTSGLKTDNQVEEVLGKMLVPSKIPIVRWQFKPGQISINEALRNG